MKPAKTDNQYPRPGAKLLDHPISQIFPMMALDERQQLTASIKEFGQKDDIVLLDGKILDGRNRYESCRELGKEPNYRFYDYTKDGQSPTAFVMIHNMHRRNLTTSQKSAVAVEVLPFFEQEAAQRKSTTLIHHQTVSIGIFKPEDESQEAPQEQEKPKARKAPIRAAEEAGKAVGVSARSVATAAAVKKQDPKAFEKVKAGETTLNAAASKLEKRQAAQAEYEAALTRIRTVLGDSLVQAIKDGSRLKSKSEVFALAALKDEEMTRIRGLIEDGWTIKKAVAYKIKSIGRTHSIGDLVNRAAAQNGMLNLDIDGWRISVQRIKEGE